MTVIGALVFSRTRRDESSHALVLSDRANFRIVGQPEAIHLNGSVGFTQMRRVFGGYAST